MSSSGASRYKRVGSSIAGVPLVNGTPIIASLTAPNDGTVHLALLSIAKVVTVQEVGGQIAINGVINGQAFTTQLDAGGHPAGTFGNNMPAVSIDPNTVVSISQFSALTGGASTLVLSLAVL